MPAVPLQPGERALPPPIAPALQLATLAELCAKIANVRTIDEIMGVVARDARWILNHQHCAILMDVPGDDGVRVYAPDAAVTLVPHGRPDPLHSGLAHRVLTTGQPVRLEELDPAMAHDALDALALARSARSVLLLPLSADNRVIGALAFSSVRLHAFPPDTLALGRFLSLQVAGAAQNALLFEELDGRENVIVSLALAIEAKDAYEELDGRENVIVSLALAIEAKDAYTEGHCQRLAQYAARLGHVLGFSDDQLTKLRMAAILHDVGKIAVPEAVLQKPAELTDAEYATLQQHPVIGEDICRPLRSLRSLLPAIRHHHERWDGRGYPDGLVGEAIPLHARIIAIVDAFDAMTSDRPYRPGMPVERALAILQANRGPQWDPLLLPPFIALIEADAAAVELVPRGAHADAPLDGQTLWSARRTVAP